MRSVRFSPDIGPRERKREKLRAFPFGAEIHPVANQIFYRSDALFATLRKSPNEKRQKQKLRAKNYFIYTRDEKHETGLE